jgi:cell wall-associated NlpC family hydrolase
MKRILIAASMLLLAGCAPPPVRDGEIGVPSQEEASSARSRELMLHALSQIGVPYRYGGSTPEDGFDCSGLVRYVFARVGVALPRTTYAMSTLGIPVSPEALQPGDLVFFDTLRKPFSHVGIYLGEQRFIHAPTTGGTVQLVNMRERYWQTRYEGARRIPAF